MQSAPTTCDSPQQQARARQLQRHIMRLESRLAAVQGRANRLAWSRLGVFLAAAAGGVGLLAGVSTWAGIIAAAVGLMAFDRLARAHAQVKAAAQRYTIWLSIQQTHAARLGLEWDHIPPPVFPAPRPDHPLELDLDLTGEYALHRLLDTCVSLEGSARLRDWLSSGVPDPPATDRRQALVRELMCRPIFRDKLRLYGVQSSQDPNHRWNGKRLQAWLTMQAAPAGTGIPLLLTALGIVNTILFALHQAGHLPPVWGITFLPYAAIYLWKVQQLGDPFSRALSLTDPLRDLSAVFAHLETSRYAGSPALAGLCAPFQDQDQRPSRQLQRLSRVLSAASVRRNPLLWMLISVVIPWDLFVAHQLEQRRADLTAQLPGWLETWFELEALCALAAFADRHPDYSFPAWHEPPTEAPLLDAQAIGHPLIPAAQRVCNSFTLPTLGSLALITGSNMSGKSTFLRTLGVNLCLAHAGGPVCAAALHIAHFELFTCIRVTDSVTNGISYFYAEVKRLKALLDRLQAQHHYPVFYLVDEIFRGTNNRERLIGSQSYITALVGGYGCGVLSTHDLELVQLADQLPRIINYHFEETIADGRMNFDYLLRSGPSPTTNALKIMRMEGLPVITAE